MVFCPILQVSGASSSPSPVQSTYYGCNMGGMKNQTMISPPHIYTRHAHAFTRSLPMFECHQNSLKFEPTKNTIDYRMVDSNLAHYTAHRPPPTAHRPPRQRHTTRFKLGTLHRPPPTAHRPPRQRHTTRCRMPPIAVLSLAPVVVELTAASGERRAAGAEKRAPRPRR